MLERPQEPRAPMQLGPALPEPPRVQGHSQVLPSPGLASVRSSHHPQQQPTSLPPSLPACPAPLIRVASVSTWALYPGQSITLHLVPLQSGILCSVTLLPLFLLVQVSRETLAGWHHCYS